MSYFSERATWLSLVDGPEYLLPESEVSASHFEEIRPPAESAAPAGAIPFSAKSVSPSEDPDQLRLTTELRHRLFFQHGELEFGPALFQDLLKLARAENDPEESLACYCRARQVAKQLAEQTERACFLAAWLEADRIIAEIHHHRGNPGGCSMYAREGLDTIKKNKFEPSMDMRITRLAVRFSDLLGGNKTGA